MVLQNLTISSGEFGAGTSTEVDASDLPWQLDRSKNRLSVFTSIDFSFLRLSYNLD